MGMPVTPQWDQEDYAFYNDGSESASTLIGSGGSADTQCRYDLLLPAGDWRDRRILQPGS